MWFLSPSGWPTYADSPEEQADLTAAGYVPIDESQVQAAIDAYHAGSPPPVLPDFVTVDELQDPASPASAALRAVIVAPPLSAVEGVPLTGYGHSWVAGPPASSGDGGRFFDRISRRLHMRDYTNLGVSGQTIQGTARKVFDTWAAGTSYGVVGLCCVGNNELASTEGDRTEGELVAPMRLILATLHSSGRYEDTGAAFAYHGTWTAQTGDGYASSGTYHETSTVGDYVDIYVPSDPCYVSVRLHSAGNGGVITATRSGDGQVIATYDTSQSKTDGTVGGLRLAGLGGATTVRLTLTSGARMGVDCVLPQGDTPPLAVWVREPGAPADPAGNDSFMQTVTDPAIEAMITAEFPATIVVPLPSGWDPATGTGPDSAHLSDWGNQIIASQAVTSVVATAPTYRPGQNVTHTALAVAAAAQAPAYSAGAPVLAGYTGSATSGGPATVSLPVTAGDLLVLMGAANDAGQGLAAPTDDMALTWTERANVPDAANTQPATAWTAVVAASGTVNITVDNTVTGSPVALTVQRWTGHGGVGSATGAYEYNAAAPSGTLPFTTTADHSGVALFDADWDLGPSPYTWTSTAGAVTETWSHYDASFWAVNAGAITDAGTAGSESATLTTSYTEHRGSMFAVEVLPA